MRTFIDCDPGAVEAIYPDVQERTPSSTTFPELNQIKTEPLNLSSYKDFQRLVHVESRYAPRTKKCGDLPHIQAQPGVLQRTGNLRTDFLRGKGQGTKQKAESRKQRKNTLKSQEGFFVRLYSLP